MALRPARGAGMKATRGYPSSSAGCLERRRASRPSIDDGCRVKSEAAATLARSMLIGYRPCRECGALLSSRATLRSHLQSGGLCRPPGDKGAGAAHCFRKRGCSVPGDVRGEICPLSRGAPEQDRTRLNRWAPGTAALPLVPERDAASGCVNENEAQAAAAASSGAVTVPMPSISLVNLNSLLSRNISGLKSWCANTPQTLRRCMPMLPVS